MGDELKAGTPRWILIATALVGLVAASLAAAAKYYEFRKARAEAANAPPAPEPDPETPARPGGPAPGPPAAEKGKPGGPGLPWAALVGNYEQRGKEDRRQLVMGGGAAGGLLVSSGKKPPPDLSRAWGRVGTVWLFDFGSIDLFSVEPVGPGQVRWCVYWKGCADGFRGDRLPDRGPDEVQH